MTTPDHEQTRFELTTDDVVEIARIGKTKDEKQFERDRKARRKLERVEPNAMPASGPACGRCQFWMAPVGKAKHGTCRMRQILMKRIPAGWTGGTETPPGTVVERHPVTGKWMESPEKVFPFYMLGEFEQFRCGPAWSCGSYVARVETGRAA